MPDFTARGIKYPQYNDNLKSTATSSALVDAIEALATTTESAIDEEADRQSKGEQLVTEHLDLVTAPGTYWTRQNTEATTAKGYPFEAYGNLVVFSASVNDANVTQIYYPSQRYATGFAMRARHNTVWEAWQYFMPGAHTSEASAGGSGSGFKVTPLALTLGQTGVDGNTAKHYRLPLNFNSPITRWRLHIRNWNPRLGSVKTGAVNFTGLWVGKHAGDGAFTGAPTLLRGAFATPADGSDWVSAWFTAPISQDEYLLSYGYTAPTAPAQLVGGCWHGATADAGATSPAVSRTTAAPFDMWLEAETPASTPVVGVLGDSLSCGVGSTLPVHDSVISQYARKIGALPYHLAASGDSMNGMLSVNPSKVTRWEGLAKPDSILWAVGSNDIADGADLATLQSRFALLGEVVAGITPSVYLADIMPRDGWAVGSTEEATRRQYNNWLRDLPGGARDLFAFAPSISTDDETITPAYDSGDGTHLNTAGYTRNMDTIVRPMTSRRPYTIDQTAGRVVKVWDYLNNREQVIYDDSGVRDVTAIASFVTSGLVYFRVKAGWCSLTFQDVIFNYEGTILNVFPITGSPLAAVSPLGALGQGFVVPSNGGQSYRLSAMPGGRVASYGGVPLSTYMSGSVVWPMDRPMPSAIPGTAVGSVPA